MHTRIETAAGARVGRGFIRASSLMCALAALVLLLGNVPSMAQFELTDQDIDLFMINPGASGAPPNVLVLLDNTANWNTPFEAEKAAMVSVIDQLDQNFRLGLMMFPETGSPNDSVDGGYVRFAVRDMNVTNKTAMKELFQGADGNGGFDKLSDKGNNATFSLLMYEAYAYYAGMEARSGYGKVKRDYHAAAASPNPYNPIASVLPDNAFASKDSRTYQSPIVHDCQKNFIVIISNGPASDNSSSLSKARELLAGMQGGAAPTQINIPSPNDGSENNWTDEYARFMATRDCSPRAGDQRITTFVIEVNPGTNKTDLDHTALMKSTAHFGNGEYIAVRTAGVDGSALAKALIDILTQIQAVNSVFASATLPVSVNVRGTNANQVYMGIFRPDRLFRPRWFGNMKLYQIGVDTTVSPPDLFLSDAAGREAESRTTGFIVPEARSFWTEPSTYWSYLVGINPLDETSPSDSPDGPFVEKGGAAQQQRQTAPANRNLYTCAGGCTSGHALSDDLFNAANAAITSSILGAGSADERGKIIEWARGVDVDDENVNGTRTDARPSIHGDVLHSRPAVINYNRSGANDDNDVFVFYGANDGFLRAIQGGFGSAGGQEAWGFIAPEHLGKLKRLRENTPLIRRATTKSYFFDGPITTYTHDVNGDGRLVAADGDKVLLFAAMRRGGRYLYAFDVSEPLDPRFLWKKGCSDSSCDIGYSGLGQTWSDPTVTFLRAYDHPVLVMGAGYDARVEDVPPCLTTASSQDSVSAIVGATVTYNLDGTCSASGGTEEVIPRSRGRGVLVIHALTGQVLKKIGTEAGSHIAADMHYSIAGEVVALNRDRDISRPLSGRENVMRGYADRLYAVDTGGNVWRVDVADADSSTWRVAKVAALGGSGLPRKFLHRVDVVYATDASGHPYDAILIGSGDREHPFDATIQNRVYMIKDRDVLPVAPATTRPVITEDMLFDATDNCLQECTGGTQATAQAALEASSGWFMNLAPGEKSVGAATTVSGILFFNTNQPSSNACASTLGIAREYQMSYSDATAVRDQNVDGEIEDGDRWTEHPGGGLLPEPVPILVEIDEKHYQGVISGPSVHEVDVLPFGARLRNFWHKRLD